MIKKTILASIVGSLVLVGCGGGGGGESGGSDGGGNGSATVIQGRAIDGYINGATVFLDKNFNGVKDSGEQSATTGAEGLYSLDLSGEVCRNSAPLVVSVPVGAIDEQLGVVSEKYTLTMPPKGFATGESGTFEGIHVTPLTSMVWNEIQIEASNQGIELDCNELATANSTQSNWLEAELVKAQDNVASTLGLSDSNKNDIYSDYVASRDDDLHIKAQEIVEDFQEVEKIKDEAPSGSEVVLLDPSRLSDYGITYVEADSISYVLTKTATTETVSNLNNTTENFYKKVSSVLEDNSFMYTSSLIEYNGDSTSCEFVQNAKEKVNDYYQIETVRSKTASSDCSSAPYDNLEQNITGYKSTTVDGVQGEVTTSHKSVAVYSAELVSIPTTGTTLSDVENTFVTLRQEYLDTDVSLQVKDFESDFSDTQSGTEPDSWVRTYQEDHEIIFGNDNQSVYVKRDNTGIWTRSLYNLEEDYCMSQYVVDNGNNPMDDWDQETTTNGTNVWDFGGNMTDAEHYAACQLNQSNWDTDTIYWPITSLTPSF